MDGPTLQNLISKGWGVAARRLGTPFMVFRPRGICNPLATLNRVIKLNAVFNAEDESFRRVAGYGDAVWWGVFDSLYTRAGDYLSGLDICGNAVVFFIAAQRPLLPAQCVKTNRVVKVLRPPAPPSGGYGGMVLETAVPIIDGWPASILAQVARVSGTLPESKFGNWTLLLPLLPATILVGDVVTDDNGRSFLVAAAEQSDLGWRITIKQVAG
jgi:hypothetical protein